MCQLYDRLGAERETRKWKGGGWERGLESFLKTLFSFARKIRVFHLTIIQWEISKKLCIVVLNPKISRNFFMQKDFLMMEFFRLHCFQSTSGVKFVVVGVAGMSGAVEGLLRRIYELYADYALKNPFYSMDMPIRCQRFDDAIKNLIEKHDKHSMVTV